MAIPASQLVNVLPRVLAGTGNDLVFNGLFITSNNETPTNTIFEFFNASEVGAYFGLLSEEYKAAVHYFNGFTNSDIKPTKILFFRHTSLAVAPFLRGGDIGTQSQALSNYKKIRNGSLTVTLSETMTISDIDLSVATSLSDVAQILQNKINSANIDPSFTNATVFFSSLHNAFVIVSGTLGEDSIIGYAEGAIAESLKLTENYAVLSAGANENLTTPGILTSGALIGVNEAVKNIADGSFKFTVDKQELTIADLNFKKFYTSATSAKMIGKATGDVLATLQALTDGSLTFTIDGAKVNCSELNFTTAEDYDDIATTITAKLQSKGVVSWVTDHFEVTASSVGTNSTIAACTNSSGGTAIAETLKLSANDNPTITQGTAERLPTLEDIRTVLDDAISDVDVELNENILVFTSKTEGNGSQVSFASSAGIGTDVSSILMLTSDTGAVSVQGITSTGYIKTMELITAITQNFVTFTTIDLLNQADVLSLADWSNAQFNAGTQYLYIYWDNDPNLLESSTTNTTADILKKAGYTGVTGVYDSIAYAAFIMGTAASIAWEKANSTITFAFKSQSGLVANVETGPNANTLLTKGMNFIGNYASRNDNFILFQNGQMFGDFAWIDTYLNSTWLNNALQVQILAGLQAAKRVSYTPRGYALVRAWVQDVITRAINNGVIEIGVPLSETQKTQIMQEVGKDISSELNANGFYLKIAEATAQIRQQRASPDCSLYYTYGGSIQKINVPSIAIV